MPAEPWLAREDWAARRVVYKPVRGALGVLAFALLWCAISFPGCILILVRPKESAWLWLAAIFPLIGLFLLLGAFYGVKSALHYGTATLLLPAVPLKLGSNVRTRVELKNAPEDGVTMRVVSVSRTARKSNRDRVLWQHEAPIAPGAIQRTAGGGVSVPIEFDLPAGGQPVHEIQPGYEEVLWLLELKGAGGDFDVRFELPVF
jgi:hypothetical protein